MTREVQDDCMIDALSRETRACAARQHRHSVSTSNVDSCGRVVGRAGEHDRNRFHFVQRGVGRVEQARGTVDQDIGRA